VDALMSVFPTSTAEWIEQKRQIEERITACQASLEAAETWERACFLQGEIASLRWLLGEAEPAPRARGVGSTNYVR
jgi:hypothetical protein